MGRHPRCPLPPDLRGDPDALFYKTQKAVLVKVTQSPDTLIELNTLSAASAALESTKSLSSVRIPIRNVESARSSVGKTFHGTVHCWVGWESSDRL
jgi:hypothetical protein